MSALAAKRAHHEAEAERKKIWPVESVFLAMKKVKIV